MTATAKPLSVELKHDGCPPGSYVRVNNDLEISFRRTIRVPDNEQTSHLPPDLGAFPLKPVSAYVDKLTPAMAAKGGVLFPMYQSEAMWINFSSAGIQDYMIKIYVGGVSAISGEPANENAQTKLRRHKKQAERRTLQDYLVVPGQYWLDGIATADGTVRQFVAMPFGSGHSVEAQVTGQDATGGIQIEITPYRERATQQSEQWVQPPPGSGHSIFVKLTDGKTVAFNTNASDTIAMLMNRIWERTGISADKQRLIYSGKQLEAGRTLKDYNIEHEATIHLVLRLRGGFMVDKPAVHEMSIAAGGKIKQVIHPDRHGQDWLPERTTVFNVQVLNPLVYKAVTGTEPPANPVTAEIYAASGFPFYEMYEEPSGVSGDFSIVKSVGEIDNVKDEVVEPKCVVIGSSAGCEGKAANGSMDLPLRPIGLVNPNGSLRKHRTVRDLEKELENVHIAEF